MTMLSRALGLARDVVFARLIGADSGADAFYVAFKIPNFLRRLFAEGAFSQAFVPVLAEYKQNGSQAAVKELVDRVSGALGLSLLLLTGLAVIGAPVLTLVFASGFLLDNPGKFAQTTELIRITFPYLFLISMTGFAGAILNSYGRFAIPAFTPVLLNICLITAGLVAAPWFAYPELALAWGVFAAGVAQLLFQLPFLARMRMLPAPKLDLSHPGVRKIAKLMVPALFGVSVSQLNLLLDTVFASYLPNGSVAWLYYSDRISELPLGVIGVAIGTVILPSLSSFNAERDSRGDAAVRQFSATMDWALRLIWLIGLPAAVAILILAEPILVTLFQYGKFTAADTAMTRLSLCAYALGLLAFMLIKVLAPGYFARQDVKTPVKIGIIAMFSNMVMNIIFVLPLYFYFQIGHVGLALATTVSAFLNAFLLYRGLRRAEVYAPAAGWWRWFLSLGVAVVMMAAVLIAFTHWWTQWSDWQAWDRIWRLACICVAGMITYGAVLLFAGVRMKHLRSPGRMG